VVSYRGEGNSKKQFYFFCVPISDNKEKTIIFKITTGVHAQDYSQIAQSQHLEPLETELQRLLDIVKETRANVKSARNEQSEIYASNSK
jgi:hypothetical protein